MKKPTIELSIWDDNDIETVHLLPTKREVCQRCNGDGHHGNPAFDGLPMSAFDDDEDFNDDYFSGRLDVTCEECHGERVVDVLDRDACPASLLEEWDLQEHCMWESAQEAAAERRAGC